MRERPIEDLLTALRELGAKIVCEEKEGFLPLAFFPSCPQGNTVHIKGSVSSQYLTALLMIAPLIAPQEGLKILLEGELISRPYVAITIAMMATFGVSVEEIPQGFLIKKAKYQTPGTYLVEGDASGASYFLALGALAGGPVRVEGVGANALQGDTAFIDVLGQMGAIVHKDQNFLETAAPLTEELCGLTVDCTQIPDAAMTLVPMVFKAKGTIKLTGIGSWRVKETDRIAAMAQEMKKFGAVVYFGKDWLSVSRGEIAVPEKVIVKTYDDHRMAMSLALVAAAAGVSLVIEDPSCTAKTYPNYFSEFFSLIHNNTKSLNRV